MESSASTESFNDYIRRMSRPDSWGDGLVLAYASRLYKMEIHVVGMDGSIIKYSLCQAQKDDSRMPATTQPLILGFVSTTGSSVANHYVYLRDKSCEVPPSSTCLKSTGMEML